MVVALLDLDRQYQSIKDNIDGAISRVLSSQQFILGDEVSLFERELTSTLETNFSLGVSSGTDALVLALMALNIGPGDEVITSTFTFFATAGSIHRVGAKPVFVDIEGDSFNLSPEAVKKAITDRTKAIIPVHLFGQAAKMDEIMSIAKHHNLFVIEDCAQAQGARFKGIQVGNFGHVGCFSFFPSKNLGCAGDGGAVNCNDENLYSLLKSLRGHGMNPNVRYLHERVGGNFRIDAIQAAILGAKLPYLNSWIEKRRANAKRYIEIFQERLGKKADEVLGLPFEMTDCYHTYNQFTLRVPFRDALTKKAKEKGIGMMVYYPIPLHLQPCFEYLGYKRGDLPVSEIASQEVASIPIYPELTANELQEVAEFIIKTGQEEGYF